MHLFVLGRGNEARRRFRLVDRPIAVNLGAARLRLGLRAQRLRGRLRVIEPAAVTVHRIALLGSQQLGMQYRRRSTHALAPFKIWAIWMNFIGTPMRSAQPC